MKICKSCNQPLVAITHSQVQLTRRETQVAKLIAEGLSNKLIADRLDISEHTAKFHVMGLRLKLKASTRGEAAVKAIGQGLIVFGST